MTPNQSSKKYSYEDFIARFIWLNFMGFWPDFLKILKIFSQRKQTPGRVSSEAYPWGSFF